MSAPHRRATELRDAAWLTTGPAAKVLAALNGEGEEARVVGGAVRNALLQMPVADIDIATTARPEEIIRRAKVKGYRTVPTGLDHGTVTVIVDGQPVEVTTLREDVETFGRKAKVAFGRDWKRDAERRDFTINALSASADGIVHDYVGGLDDLAVRRVRFIGDAGGRIAEDYLRILRFFRIHAAYGRGELDRLALAACIAGRAGLVALSPERIQGEFKKLLVAPGAPQSVQVMGDAGLLLILLGGVTYHDSLNGMIAVEQQLGVVADPVRRLAALAVAVPEDAERLAQRLRLSNADARRLDSMAYRWRRWASLQEAGARVRLYKLGAERYRDRMMMAFARLSGDARNGRMMPLVTLPERWPPPAFPLKASDFLARGLDKGPALGVAMRLAEEAWISAGFPSAESVLADIADTAARASSGQA